MKRLLLIGGVAWMTLSSLAQIHLTPYLPENMSLKSPSAYNVLLNKLNNLISQNGLVVSDNSQRFIITCNCVEVSKHIVAGAPNKIAYTLDCGFYIGDGMTGVKYASTSIQTKGVGNSENKAYMNAIKNIKIKSQQISSLIDIGSKRIIQYYETNKNDIFSKANACVSNGDFDEAIYQLTLVPQGCSYYEKAQDKLIEVYNLKTETHDRQLLMQAKSIWASNQNKESASQAVDILSDISPSSSAYDEAQALLNNINNGVKRINDREWAEYSRQQEHNRKMDVLDAKAKMQRDKQNAEITQTTIKAAAVVRMQKIQAARDVAVAYARSRPRIVYHIHGWY